MCVTWGGGKMADKQDIHYLVEVSWRSAEAPSSPQLTSGELC